MSLQPEFALLGLVGFGLAISVIVLILSDPFFRAGESEAATDCPPISVIIPLKGWDDGLLDNLTMICRQDYPVHQVIFAMESDEEPAYGIVEEVIRRFPEADLALVVSGGRIGQNGKVNNLYNGYQKARHDHLVFLDSDIRVSRDYLRRIVHPLQDPKVGLVTGITFYREARTLPAALKAISVNSNVLSLFIPAALTGQVRYASGATIAIRRAVLEEVGGLKAVANVIAEDALLGRLVYNRGYRIAVSNQPLYTIEHDESWRGYLTQTLRWHRTIRAVAPGIYASFGLFFTTFYALLFWLMNLRNLWAFLLFLFVVFFRMVMTAYYNEYLIRDESTRRYLWAVGLKDLILPVEWGMGWVGNRVEWRGSRYRILKGGVLERIAA